MISSKLIVKSKKTNYAKLFIIKEWPLLFLLILVFSGVFFTTGYYLGLLLIPIIILKTNIVSHIDSIFIFTLLFSITYVVIMNINGLYGIFNGNNLFNTFYPITFYVIGRYLMKRWYSERYFIIFIIMISFALPSLISTFNDIINNGFFNLTRTILDSKGEKILQATLHGVKLSLFIALISLIFTKSSLKSEKIYKYIFIFFGILSLLATIHFINRTGIIIFSITLIVVLNKNLKLYNSKNLISLILFLFVITIVLYLLVIHNSELFQLYSERESVDGAEITSFGGRLERWYNGLDFLIKHPYGGGVFRNGDRYYAHNFWLDVGELTGIIPFTFLLIVTILNLKRIYYLYKYLDIITPFFSSIIIALNLGFMLTAFVEPIYEGNPSYVYSYFCFWGITSVIYERLKENNMKIKLVKITLQTK